MKSFNDKFQELHKDAMKTIMDCLEEAEGHEIPSFEDCPDESRRHALLMVMYEVANQGAFNVNSNCGIFALRAVPGEYGQCLQILISYEDCTRFRPDMEYRPDFKDEYGRGYTWVDYPDHYHSQLLEIADHAASCMERMKKEKEKSAGQ